MPITPISANGLLRMHVEVTSQPHDINFYVELNDPASEDYSIVKNTPLIGTMDAQDCADILWSYLRGWWPNTVAAASWTLLERNGNIYIPREAGGTTGAGNNAGAAFLTSQYTITFRDPDQHEMRIQLPEVSFTPPSKDPANSVGGFQATFIADVVGSPDDTKPSGFLRCRTGKQPTRALFVSVDINDKFRRARGL